ncbi:MAG: hypothetical protein ACLTYW_08320 [Collinsella sp.]
MTGLRYLPESNELLVYLDSPSWTQEMTLLREIIRARMERAGAHVDGLVFKTTARVTRRPPPSSACARRDRAPAGSACRPKRVPSAPRLSAKWHHRRPKTARGPRECHESQCRVGQGRAEQKEP